MSVEEAVMSHLVLSVPQVVTSHYVIATSTPPDDPYTAVPWRVPEPFRGPAVEALTTPRLSIVTIAAGDALWRLDDLLASDDDRSRVRASAHQIVVAHQVATGAQPRCEQVARAVARALADATDGVLIDPQARQVILRDGPARAERASFRMGDQWFGTRYRFGAAGHRRGSPRGVPDPGACACLRITLLGLRRFGLPDLTIDGVDCARDLPALNLLRAVASRLLTDQWRWARRHPARPTRPLEDHPEIRPDDFWAYWGATAFLQGRPVVVRLAFDTAGTLEIGPPDGYPGTRTEWVREVVAEAMPSVVGCPADEDVAPDLPRGGRPVAVDGVQSDGLRRGGGGGTTLPATRSVSVTETSAPSRRRTVSSPRVHATSSPTTSV